MIAYADLVELVLERNPFHQARLAGWDRGSELPPLTKSELVADQAAHPPFGTNLTYELDRYVASGEINSTVPDQARAVAAVEAAYAGRDGVELDRLDGLTVAHEQWWFNVRASNTEPLLRLNAEAGDRATLDRLRDDVLAIIRSGS